MAFPASAKNFSKLVVDTYLLPLPVTQAADSFEADECEAMLEIA
jgi:hypothetical protein